MSPITAMLWAGAVLLWIGTALVLWVFFEFIADALKARRHSPAPAEVEEAEDA